MIVDNTCLSCFQTCPRQYFHRHVEGLIPIQANQASLHFGQAIHAGLEKGYTAIKEGKDFLEPALTAFEKKYRELFIVDTKRTLENGKQMLKEYASLYLPEAFKILALEQVIKKELDNFVFCGKIDCMGQMLQTGEVFILDHKTSSSMGFQLNPNHQLTGYLWLVPEAKTAGVNLLGVYTTLSRKTKEEKFCRAFTTRTENDFEQWKLWVKKTVQAIKMAESENVWPMAGNEYQCRFCSYKALCIAEMDVQTMLKDTMFKQEKWEPWAAGALE